MRNTLIKHIIMIVISLTGAFTSPEIYAFKLDANGINYIHSSTRAKYFNLCRSKIIGATKDICNCIADNTVSYIDDKELIKCDSNASYCIDSLVQPAAKKAFTQEGISTCVKKFEDSNKQK